MASTEQMIVLSLFGRKGVGVRMSTHEAVVLVAMSESSAASYFGKHREHTIEDFMQPQEIEQKLGLKKLSVVPGLLQMMTYDRRNSCMLDAEGQVIGLNLRDNRLTFEHVGFLWKIRGLQALNLSENKFSRLSIPAGLSSLRYLNLCENPGLQVLHFEAALPALEEIDLSESNLRELHFPAGFDALRLVYLQKNKLRKFSIAGACPALRLLDLAAPTWSNSKNTCHS